MYFVGTYMRFICVCVHVCECSDSVIFSPAAVWENIYFLHNAYTACMCMFKAASCAIVDSLCVYFTIQYLALYNGLQYCSYMHVYLIFRHKFLDDNSHAMSFSDSPPPLLSFFHAGIETNYTP